MFVWCAAVLIASTGFLTELPEPIRAKLASTNETHGSFVMNKILPDGRALESTGVYAIRPGKDFTWTTLEPFDSVFRATLETYCYSNEDECVTKPLKDLKGIASFADAAKGDFSAFFKAFDARYMEDASGAFHVLAKPKDSRLQRVLTRVEADGCLTNWTLLATFPDQTKFKVEFKDN